MPQASACGEDENRAVGSQIVYPRVNAAGAAKQKVSEQLPPLEPDSSGFQPMLAAQTF
jgi:hypothetical protein